MTSVLLHRRRNRHQNINRERAQLGWWHPVWPERLFMQRHYITGGQKLVSSERRESADLWRLSFREVYRSGKGQELPGWAWWRQPCPYFTGSPRVWRWKIILVCNEKNNWTPNFCSDRSPRSQYTVHAAQVGFWQVDPILLSSGGFVIFQVNGGPLSQIELWVLYVFSLCLRLDAFSVI